MKRAPIFFILAVLITGLSGSCNKDKPTVSMTDTPVDLPNGALPGAFSVSATKKVYFSQGNLYWNGITFRFEETQYGVPTSRDISHLGFFHWSSDASVACAEEYNETGATGTDVFFTNDTAETAKSDFTVYGVTGRYRLLSADEWKYLLDNHTYKWVAVNGMNGYAIAPDNFAGVIADSYPDDAALAENNLVFLPAAGYCIASTLYSSGSYGSYWNSSSSASYGYFFSEEVHPDCHGRCDAGYCVRLVTEAQ